MFICSLFKNQNGVTEQVIIMHFLNNNNNNPVKVLSKSQIVASLSFVRKMLEVKLKRFKNIEKSLGG